ncbi:MAG: hypothetical protein QNJ65_01090 [Xenococcaceae cyanobacterium MO_234.B1]|nr:hypothetical protein [Xenococcaceae cyanobacterium MO_234.B1]
MARSIQQIKQDLETLQKTVAEAATELQQLYNDYLQVLSQSVKQQLVLASYQLCTQIYPESFLKLSFKQRQQLQEKIREISQEVAEFLQQLNNIEQNESSPEQTELNLLAEMIRNLPLGESSNQEIATDKNQLPALENSDEAESQPEIIIAGDPSNIQELAEHLENIAAEKLESDKLQEINFSNPEHLVLWQRRVEKNLKQTLDDTSRKVNKSLQDNNIIPSRLPTKVIDMAIQANEVTGNGHKVNSLPNILNLVIETEKESKSSNPKVAQISLLRLRLSEIEFTDPSASLQRNKIRNFSQKIEQLRQQYRAKEREYAIAEAEAAWRAGWYEN